VSYWLSTLAGIITVEEMSSEVPVNVIESSNLLNLLPALADSSTKPKEASKFAEEICLLSFVVASRLIATASINLAADAIAFLMVFLIY
jgi:hypothetical protein